jgi:hypothetical protein
MGVALAFTTMWSVIGAIEPAAGEMAAIAAGGAVLGLGLGLGAGLLPGLALGRRLGGFSRWLAGSLAGGLAAGVVVFPVALANDTNPAGPAVLVVLGLVGALIGVGQWLALRRRVARAGWWVAASAAALMASMAVAFGLGGEGREGQAIVACALVYALISAGVMGWLLADGSG